MTKYYSDENHGSDMTAPLPTATTKDRMSLVTAMIDKAYGGGYSGSGSAICNPLGTVTTHDHNRLVAAFMERQYEKSTGHKADEPLATVTVNDKSNLVEVFLKKYNGRSNIIKINGEEYKIVDICMRMLTPRELYNAQGFPKDYIIDHDSKGNPYPKTQQVAKAGNSVPPAFATALVRANWTERCVKPISTMQELNEMIFAAG